MKAHLVRQILFVPPAPVVWAQHTDAFRRNGVDAETTLTLSSNQIGEGLARGEWDVGIGVMDNVIAWNEERKAGLKIFAQLERSTVMGFFAAGKRSLEEIVQQPIAVDSTTNGFVLVLYRALARAGIDWGACRYDSVGGVKHRFDALVAGRATSTILVPPFDGLARSQGFECLWTGAEMAPAYPGVIACARASWLAENRETAARYLSALLEASRWAAAHPEEAQGALRAARYSEDAATRLTRDRVDDLAPSLEGWAEITALRRESGLMPHPEPTAREVIDSEIRKLVNEGL